MAHHLRLDLYGPKDRNVPYWREGNSEFKRTLDEDFVMKTVPRQGDVIRRVDTALEEVRLYSVKWVVWNPGGDLVEAVLRVEEISGLA